MRGAAAQQGAAAAAGASAALAQQRGAAPPWPRSGHSARGYLSGRPRLQQLVATSHQGTRGGLRRTTSNSSGRHRGEKEHCCARWKAAESSRNSTFFCDARPLEVTPLRPCRPLEVPSLRRGEPVKNGGSSGPCRHSELGDEFRHPRRGALLLPKASWQAQVARDGEDRSGPCKQRGVAPTRESAAGNSTLRPPCGSPQVDIDTLEAHLENLAFGSLTADGALSCTPIPRLCWRPPSS